MTPRHSLRGIPRGNRIAYLHISIFHCTLQNMLQIATISLFRINCSALFMGSARGCSPYYFVTLYLLTRSIHTVPLWPALAQPQATAREINWDMERIEYLLNFISSAMHEVASRTVLRGPVELKVGTRVKGNLTRTPPTPTHYLFITIRCVLLRRPSLIL